MAHPIRPLQPSWQQLMESEVEQLWQMYRASRSNYATICQILVARGVLAEMPKDLDKPIKI